MNGALRERRVYRCPTCAQAISRTQHDDILHIEEARAHELEHLRGSLTREREALARAESDVKKREAGLKKAISTAATSAAARERKQNEKFRREEVLAARAEERSKHERALSELRRRLHAAEENKTLSKIGREADAKLSDLLESHFPHDRILPTPGSRKGDVLHNVHHNDAFAGLILWERKTGEKITKAYVDKLRADVRDRRADYGVLLGDGYYRKDFRGCEIDGNIVIINAHMVRPVATMLRINIVAIHLAGLAADSRNGVAEKVLAFVTKGDFRRRVAGFVKMAETLLHLLETDRRYHDRYWRQLEGLYRQYQLDAATIDADLVKVLAGQSPRNAESIGTARLRLTGDGAA